MFDRLIESQHKSNKRRGLGVGFVTVVIHTGLIVVAVVATLGARETNQELRIDTNMVFLNPQEEQQKPPEPQVQLEVTDLRGFQTVVAPDVIPTDLPPINLEEKFDPRDYSGVGVEGGVATGVVLDPGAVYSEAVVEERPEVLARPPLQYPELLRQAGIQGTVVVEAIVDTSGRVEPPSIKIVSSPNPGFNQSAISLVRGALFRPARVRGRAVRVLIRLPIEFKITR